MWWPPDKDEVPITKFISDRSFNRDDWAETEELGWMVVLIGSSISFGLWEAINFRFDNVLLILLTIFILSAVWKAGVIRYFYKNGVWILYSAFTLPLIPLIELYIYLSDEYGYS